MRASRRSGKSSSRPLLLELLTFDRLLTGAIVHLIYWAGLGLIVLTGFGIIGAGVGMATKEGPLKGILLALPAFVGGILVVAVLTLLWRAFCEFYVAIFRISEDLRALRLSDAEVRARADGAPVERRGQI
ncbi:DUF4282 domain-containing protein [soil metagenome]